MESAKRIGVVTFAATSMKSLGRGGAKQSLHSRGNPKWWTTRFRRLPFRAVTTGLFLTLLAGMAFEVNAAQKKQCKTWVIVSDQVPVRAVGAVIPPGAVNKAKRTASYRAGQKWKQWAGATHGQAYANPALANAYRITCQVNGSPAKSVLCEARGKPCRVDNALPPGSILNRIPSRNFNRLN